MQRVDRNDASSSASTEAGWTHQRDRGWCECLDWMGLCVGLVMRQAVCGDVAGCGIIASLCCIRKIFCSDVHTVQGLVAKWIALWRQCKVSTAVQCFNSSAIFQQQCKVSTAVWGGSECGIRQHSRQIIHQWIIPAKHFSGDFNSSSLSYDLLFD